MSGFAGWVIFLGWTQPERLSPCLLGSSWTGRTDTAFGYTQMWTGEGKLLGAQQTLFTEENWQTNGAHRFIVNVGGSLHAGRQEEF